MRSSSQEPESNIEQSLDKSQIGIHKSNEQSWSTCTLELADQTVQMHLPILVSLCTVIKILGSKGMPRLLKNSTNFQFFKSVCQDRGSHQLNQQGAGVLCSKHIVTN